CGFEFIGLGDGPFGHESAVRPATDAEAIGIGDAPSHQITDSGHYILEVAAAPVGSIAFDKFLAVADAAANIWVEDRVTACDEKLSPGFDAIFPSASRAAMDQRDQRQLGVAVIIGGLEQCGFDFLPIERSVFVDLGADERVLLPSVVEMGELL